MKLTASLTRVLRFGWLAGAMLNSALYAQSQTDFPLPHLEKRGEATQLIVDGKPWLILGGELSNTGSSSLEYMAPVWPRMVRLNLNTVLVAVAWQWIEPVEGHFDFSLVDGLLEGARANNLRVVFLWFGSWKN
ncbi:MAG TPA: beta-galactosidase, partial [Opitutaceae bacterium]|nr:beta-galactosidase [Opitutaceae bacterium]